MDIRTILVPLGDAAGDRVALGQALSVARRMNAHVEAVFVETFSAEQQRYGGETYLTPDMLDAMRASAVQHRETTRALFVELTAAEKVPEREEVGPEGPSASWRIVTGDPVRAVAREAVVHDLVVLAAPAAGTGGDDAGDVDGMLLASGRPTLLATGRAAMAAGGAGDIVLVGWNRSLQSGRALTEGLPFMRRASRVHLLQVDTGTKPGPGVDRAARYLARHGISAEVRTVASGSAAVGAVLLDHAADTRADLLIMGAYSRSRLREMLLGGVTRHLVAHSRIPLLMVH